jgi:hypothetical protein
LEFDQDGLSHSSIEMHSGTPFGIVRAAASGKRNEDEIVKSHIK